MITQAEAEIILKDWIEWSPVLAQSTSDFVFDSTLTQCLNTLAAKVAPDPIKAGAFAPATIDGLGDFQKFYLQIVKSLGREHDEYIDRRLLGGSLRQFMQYICQNNPELIVSHLAVMSSFAGIPRLVKDFPAGLFLPLYHPLVTLSLSLLFAKHLGLVARLKVIDSHTATADNLLKQVDQFLAPFVEKSKQMGELSITYQSYVRHIAQTGVRLVAEMDL